MSFKNKNIVREFPFFSHFACLPLIEQTYRQYIQNAQQLVEDRLKEKGYNIEQTLKRHNHLLGHLTLFMLTLRREQVKNKLRQILQQEKQQIKKRLNNLQIHPSKISYFTRVNKNQKCKQLTVIYMEIDQKANQSLISFVDYLVRILLKHEILIPEELKPMRITYNHKSGLFEPETFHISLFRCKNLLQTQQVINSFNQANHTYFTQQSNQNMIFECKLLDVSTMMAFDTTQFYQPLARMILSQNLSKQQNKEQEQRKEQSKQMNSS